MTSNPDSWAVAAVAQLDSANLGRAAVRTECDRVLTRLAASAAGTNDWQVQHQPNGPPTLYHGTRQSELKASLAHSKHWIAAGLAFNADIGVDVQVHKNLSRPTEMANFLCLDPKSYGDCHPNRYGGSHRNSWGVGFFDGWVLREAIAKATGGSVLMKHAVESELGLACERHGQVVRAGEFEAIVEILAANVSFAMVVRDRRAMQHCA